MKLSELIAQSQATFAKYGEMYVAARNLSGDHDVADVVNVRRHRSGRQYVSIDRFCDADCDTQIMDEMVR